MQQEVSLRHEIQRNDFILCLGQTQCFGDNHERLPFLRFSSSLCMMLKRTLTPKFAIRFELNFSAFFLGCCVLLHLFLLLHWTFELCVDVQVFPGHAVIFELVRGTSKRPPAAPKEVGSTLSIKVVSSAPTACGSKCKHISFHVHPLQLMREVSFISRILCVGSQDAITLCSELAAVHLFQQFNLMRPCKFALLDFREDPFFPQFRSRNFGRLCN